MPTLTIEYRDENERLTLEQAIAYVTDLRQLALDAPAGTALMPASVSPFNRAAPRYAPPWPPPCKHALAPPSKKGGCPFAHPGRCRGRHDRTILTAVGPVTLERTYFTCSPCHQGEFAADRILGVNG